MTSASITLLVFGAGPLCAMMWWFTGGMAVEVLAPPPGLQAEPAVLQLALDVDADSIHDLLGEGGTEEGDPMAGPDPTVGSGGDGSSDAVVDASGDEGEDDETSEAPDPVEGAAAILKRTTASRTARGVRTPGARGYSDRAETIRNGVRRRRGRNRCKDSHPDVEKSEGEAAWVVNRNLVEWYTKSFKRFNSLGWSGPYQNDDFKGWKIGGFGCNSPLHFAGLRRGDIVLTVNDKPTRNWLQIFGMYNKLRRKDAFEVVLMRRGKRKVLRYTLVEGGPPTTG